jgi:hypothetical protein
VPGPPSTTSAARSRADDGVLVGRDGAEHVAHPGRAAAAQAGDEGGLVVERDGVSLEPGGGEHFVPVVADPAAGPAVPAAAGQAHRVGVGRSEERFGRGGAPVEQQPATRLVGEAESADVDRLGVVRADHAPQAQVKAEPAQQAEPGGQPVDLQVPLHRVLADAAGCPALGLEAAGQVGDRLLEGLPDGGEVPLVGRDQRRVGLGGETGGKVERAVSQQAHVVSSDACPQVLGSACDYAARPGSCRKPRGAL